MLAGIVVSNGILLVDYTNVLRQRDKMPIREAVEVAGRTRLRPILMTSIATALGLVPMALGTDTTGSIRNPSSYNQLVGVRPTVGLASRDGIVPLALSQDTGGPIARSVEDAAIALDAVVGSDPNDAATADADAHVPDSYTSYLDKDALEGTHVAYFTSMVPPSLTTAAAMMLSPATLSGMPLL